MAISQRALTILSISVWLVAGMLAVKVTRRGAVEALIGLGREAQAQHPVPYAVFLDETIHSANGSSRIGGRFTHAVRADGAYMQRLEFLGQNKSGKQVSQRMLTFQNGDRIEMDEIREVRSSTNQNNVGFSRTLRDPAARCLATYGGTHLPYDGAATPDEDVVGYRTIRVSRTGLTTWFGLDAGCALLRLRREDADGSYAVQQATRVLLDAPPTDLFEVPSTYAEVPPSVLFRLPVGSKQAKERDAYYVTHRSKGRSAGGAR